MLQLLAVFLVYAGALTALVGFVCLLRPLRTLGVRSRRAAAIVFAAGAACALAGFALPAPLVSVAGPHTRLDTVMPAYHFHEVHTVRVHAPPPRILDAVRRVTAGEIRLFRTLTWIRSPRLGPRVRESILDAPGEKPILEVALGSGFVELGSDSREVVLGTLLRLAPSATGAPRFARAAMNFRVVEEADGWSRLSTETRVIGSDDGARRRFAVYWRTIYPGSALIRRMWLRAVKRRAESSWEG